MRDTATFSLALVASGAKDLTRLPLACLLAAYCEREQIDQAELMSKRYLNCQPPSLQRLALVTVDVTRLIEVLQGMQPVPAIPWSNGHEDDGERKE